MEGSSPPSRTNQLVKENIMFITLLLVLGIMLALIGALVANTWEDAAPCFSLAVAFLIVIVFS